MHKHIHNNVYQDSWEEKKLEYYKLFIDIARGKGKLKKDCVPITEQ
jgi:hypothetical protein